MVTGGDILGAVQGLRVAFDLLQGLNSAAKEAAINEVKVELTRHILEAQQALTAAVLSQAANAEKIRSLEHQIMEFENWETEKQRYELKDTGQGSLAFALKEGMEAGEPPHWICPQCYNERKKSILKHETLFVGRTETLVCHRCDFDVVTRGVRHEQPRTSSPARKKPAGYGR